MALCSLCLTSSSIKMRQRIQMRGIRSTVLSLSASADTDPLKTLVRQLGINTVQKHIFLCADQTKPKCCSKEAGLESWEFLKVYAVQCCLCLHQLILIRF